MAPRTSPNRFVIRKPVDQLTLSMVPAIRDKTIRNIVEDRLREHGIEPGRGKGDKIPGEVWKEPLVMPSGVPVQKVRFTKTDKTIRPIRGNTAFVKPGNLHHVCIFEIIDKKGRVKWLGEYVNMIDAAARSREGKALIQIQHPENPDAKFIMSLSQNEMLLAEFNGKEQLFRFASAVSTVQKIKLRHHTYAGNSSDPQTLIVKSIDRLRQMNARKVTVDPLGRIRWAND